MKSTLQSFFVIAALGGAFSIKAMELATLNTSPNFSNSESTENKNPFIRITTTFERLIPTDNATSNPNLLVLTKEDKKELFSCLAELSQEGFIKFSEKDFSGSDGKKNEQNVIDKINTILVASYALKANKSPDKYNSSDLPKWFDMIGALIKAVPTQDQFVLFGASTESQIKVCNKPSAEPVYNQNKMIFDTKKILDAQEKTTVFSKNQQSLKIQDLEKTLTQAKNNAKERLSLHKQKEEAALAEFRKKEEIIVRESQQEEEKLHTRLHESQEEERATKKQAHKIIVLKAVSDALINTNKQILDKEVENCGKKLAEKVQQIGLKSREITDADTAKNVHFHSNLDKSSSGFKSTQKQFEDQSAQLKKELEALELEQTTLLKEQTTNEWFRDNATKEGTYIGGWKRWLSTSK